MLLLSFIFAIQVQAASIPSLAPSRSPDKNCKWQTYENKELGISLLFENCSEAKAHYEISSKGNWIEQEGPPDNYCGDYGEPGEGITYFEYHPNESKTKFLFDEQSIRKRRLNRSAFKIKLKIFFLVINDGLPIALTQRLIIKKFEFILIIKRLHDLLKFRAHPTVLRSDVGFVVNRF